jgi:hypothetical protein
MAAILGWLVGGLILDIWAHHHIASTLETFFTPWHGVLYSGLLAVGTYLLGGALRSPRRDGALSPRLPPAYQTALVGVGVFALGGLADLAWHLAFGVEVDLEAAVSPSHLLLALGGLVIVSAPFRDAWAQREADFRWRHDLPALLSLAFTLTVLTTLTEYANAFSRPWAASEMQTSPPELGQMLGLVGVMVQSALVTGSVLLATLRWRLPPGAFTLVLAVNATFMSFAHDVFVFIPVAAAAGFCADVLYRVFRPTDGSPARFRMFGALVPAVLFAIYFGTLATFLGIGWSAALWVGAIGLASGVGWLTTYLVIPPRQLAWRS